MKFEKFIDSLIEFATTSGLKLIVAILLIFVGFRLVKIGVKAFSKSKVYSRMDPTARSFLKSFISITLKILLLITAAATLGVPMASMIALIGSAGLAIGLALQGSLSNIAGGFIILAFKPFVVGDYIEVGEYRGFVHGISIFYTKLYTMDNKKIMIPNSIISNQSLVDVSALPTRRVDLEFSVSYNSDISEVKRVLIHVADRHELVLKDPEPVIKLSEHDASSLKFIFRVWCATEDYWTVYYDMIEDVKKAFDENSIEIPYPQLDVHINNKGD